MTLIEGAEAPMTKKARSEPRLAALSHRPREEPVLHRRNEAKVPGAGKVVPRARGVMVTGRGGECRCSAMQPEWHRPEPHVRRATAIECLGPFIEILVSECGPDEGRL
jgi:hypothetical protein